MRAFVVGVLVPVLVIACDAGLPPPSPPPPVPPPTAVVKATPVDASVPRAPTPVITPVDPPAPTTTTAAAPKHEPGAVVVIIDRSGSMQGLKLDTAKQATHKMIETLEATDEVGVITFDSDATVVVPLQRASNRTKIEAAIKDVTAGGGTNILPALKGALAALHGSKLKLKHVLFLSDGEAPTDGIAEVANEIRAEGATISAVGVQGADRNFLAMIADAGEGRLYMVEDLGALPKLFLKEVKAAFKR
jgi:uncharacterized protein with von Willebrand factor type A (vWA) domain